MSPDPTALTEEYKHDSKYLIKWTRLGPAEAQAVIFIHGTPWSSRLWAPFALALSSSYNVYLFDNPNYGESKALGAGVDEQANDGPLVKQAEVFAALYRHWGFSQQNPPHVVAHDNAGLVSLRAILEQGCVYRSLCLIDVVAVGPWGLPFFKLVAENADVFQQLPVGMFEGIVHGYVRPGAFKPLKAADEDMLTRPWVSDEGPGQAGFIRNVNNASLRRSEDVEGRYKEIGESGLPVKIIWGKEDRWVPCERAEKLKALIGGKTELVLVEEAGHLIHLDQPERLMAEIFLHISKAGAA